ncbi:diguanylate cyclase [Ferribacterium limneticum]|uniref:diguanylate cyclase n=1 Tax=Ferribacterium limneticum TaxID=76259 RepID=UPI001CFB4A03|nr:diguanylate cyclase [Ferribacterium limneticum]UCV19554.1 diguanylate cyclase [Ferribacterium limneticum]
MLFFVFTWLGVALLLAFLLNEGRREAERKAPSDALGVTSLLEARLAAAMRRLQGNLEHLAASLPRDAFKPAAVGRYRESVVNELELFSGQFPEVSGFRVMDAAGTLLYASGVALQSPGFADRSYFKAPAAQSGNGLYFSEVIADKLSGRTFLFVIQPVLNADGGLLGLVAAPLDLDVLAKIFETINVGTKGVVAIWRADDGRQILRRPAVTDQVNQVLANNPLQRRIESGEKLGTMRLPAALEGFERVYAFQRIADYPLYVAGGLAVDDYLAEWRQTLWVAAVSALLLFLSLSLVLIRLLRAENEEEVIARKLSQSEARYRMLAENSHDVIWTLDIPSRRYTYVSPSITDMCGYLPEDVVGQSIDARLTPESASRLARDIDQRLRRMAAGDKAASVVVSELEQVCKDGEVISTEVVSSYLQDADGVAHTILGITRNVSERKAAELALRETNRQLHARIEEIGRLQVALQELAVRDSLTGLYNRRYLDETLEREVSRARREGNPLALVMLDIDYFKRVNDTYGHQVGDEALRMLATTLLADVRTEDVACRYGGEEFLILLPNMPLETAIQRAEAWRQAIEELSVALGNFHITFTISLGVAAYPEHGKTPDDLTRCADQALYRAKREGRNQVSVFSA